VINVPLGSWKHKQRSFLQERSRGQEELTTGHVDSHPLHADDARDRAYRAEADHDAGTNS
jgi:hypothetical protein